MKKLLLICFVLFSYSAQAQIDYGLRAGITAPYFGGADAVNQEMRLAYFGGAFVSFPLKDEQSRIEVGLQFAAKGSKETFANGEYAVRSYYLDLPIALRRNVLPNLDVLVGLQPSYLLENELFFDAPDFSGENRTVILLDTQGFRNFDLAPHLGLKYRFFKSFEVLATYDHGLFTLDRDGAQSVYNRVFKFGLGYTF
ncbi:outer membrane beta-barrel protein [Penaeicola halotolerans]|uniref:outer membrane beta-barrel protein n=1 Tax=Penaeicola halotolerans TaxID=2793196 RepID=UPI001CF81828|nr:outer membrane beta-barrel protein [Penaeicola halotolerans]